MQQIQTTDDLKSLGAILSVWAHPDDETFTCGGLLCAAVANKQAVACITATRGEAGSHDPSRWPPEKMGEIRDKELCDALKCLGVHHHHWLNYTDGTLKDVDQNEAVQKIKDYIDQYQPNTILTFGPDGMTGHDDHRTVSKWVKQATKGTDVAIYHVIETVQKYEAYFREADEKLNIYFNTPHPELEDEADCDILFHLNHELCATKHQALAAMPSQTEGMLQYFHDDLFEKAFCTEAFVRAN